MRFTTITAAASLAGAAFALPIADTQTADSGLVQDLEGLTKAPVAARQFDGIESQLEKLTGTGSLKAREEKDPMHEALASIFKSVSGRQVDAAEAAVGELVQPVVTGGVAKRQTEVVEELTKTLSLPTKRQAEVVEELTKSLSLPTKRQTEILDELTKSLSLPKRQTEIVEELTKSLSLPTKRQTEIVEELTKTLSLPTKRQTEVVEELTKTLSLPTKRQTEILDELTKSLSVPAKRQAEIVEDLTKSLPTRQTEIVEELTKSLSLPTKRQTEILEELTKTLPTRQTSVLKSTLPPIPRQASEIQCVKEASGKCESASSDNTTELDLVKTLEEAL